MKRVRIGDADDFPEGKVHGIEVEGRKLIVINLDGNVHALDGVCTHEYAELRMGFLLGDTIRCPLHLSRFDIETGEAIDPPAEEPLKVYSVEVRDDGVYVVLD